MKLICVAMNTNSNTIAKLAMSLWVASSANLTLTHNAMGAWNNGRNCGNVVMR
jgi:hypothetical protein